MATIFFSVVAVLLAVRRAGFGELHSAARAMGGLSALADGHGAEDRVTGSHGSAERDGKEEREQRAEAVRKHGPPA